MQHTTLVDCATLAANIEHPDWRVIDCRFNLFKPSEGHERYLAGHLPGALYADLDRDLSAPAGPTTGRHPLPDPELFAATASAWGIDAAVQVVVYDADGGAIAARLWWLLQAYGHHAVAVLDGGLGAWQAAGLPLDTAVSTSTPRRFSGTFAAERCVDVAAVVAGAGPLVDARSPERHRGEAEPIDPVAGRIPGSLNLPLPGNLGPGGRFLPAAELRARYAAALGGAAPGDAVHYCGSGVSACHNLLAMEHAGLTGSRLYVGSWSEWIRDPSRPVATGR